MRRMLWMGLGLAALLVLPAGIASADLGDRVLSLGSSGSDVVELQQGLTALGYPVPATGYYGTMTRRAVAAFQSELGLPITGRADGATAQAIKDQLAELGSPQPGDNEDWSLPPYGEGSRADRSERYVNHQPVTLQRGHELLRRFLGQQRGRDHQHHYDR